MPKLGTFIVKQTSGEIVFSDLMRNDDGVLRALLMSAGINELSANGMIDRFVFEVRHGVSANGKMTIEGFGEFSADRNNTITFVITQRNQKIGGNVKPPVEILQKIKPQPRQQIRPTTKRTVTQQQNREEESLTLGKPDKYLRGLKYDSNKNKKREEGGMSGRRSYGGSGRRLLAILIFLAIVSGVVVLLWPRKKEAVHNAEVETTTTVECDSTMMDSLSTIDSLNLVDIGGTPPTTTATPIRETNE